LKAKSSEEREVTTVAPYLDSYYASWLPLSPAVLLRWAVHWRTHD